METWSIVLISISVVAFFSLLSRNFSKNLPPSPPAFPIIGHLLWLLKPYAEMELILRNLHEKYGPIFTLYIGRKPLIFIATRSLAHEALVQNSAIFTDRPPIAPTTKIFTCNQHSISFGSYDPKWRLLRRNITSEILCLPRIRSYSHARKWAWKILVDRLQSHSQSGAPIPEENNRKLTESEVTSLCAEFLDAGTGSTSTAFQWIMANLVKYPEVQEKLFMEMKKVIGDGKEELSEEEVERVPYLKAVILEGFRRHPPAHNLLAHAATEDTVLNGFVVPKGVAVNFLVAEMGLDPKAWKDPMAFKPERFLDQGQVVYDITGSKEIKMLPFGAGRRMCAGYNLGILHLEYFVGNLVWKFQWKAMEGDGDVNFAEEDEFTIPMKYSLQANISPRVRRE
ncbi:hypothetical protein ACOSQ3_014191 [Xanthoceras sorbifolium]